MEQEAEEENMCDGVLYVDPRSAFAIVDPNRSLSRRCNDLNF